MVSPAWQFNPLADEERRVLEVVRDLVAELGHQSARSFRQHLLKHPRS